MLIGKRKVLKIIDEEIKNSEDFRKLYLDQLRDRCYEETKRMGCYFQLQHYQDQIATLLTLKSRIKNEL